MPMLAEAPARDPLLAFPLGELKQEFIRVVLDLPNFYCSPSFPWLAVEIRRLAVLLVGCHDPLPTWLVQELSLPFRFDFHDLALRALESYL